MDQRSQCGAEKDGKKEQVSICLGELNRLGSSTKRLASHAPAAASSGPITAARILLYSDSPLTRLMSRLPGSEANRKTGQSLTSLHSKTATNSPPGSQMVWKLADEREISLDINPRPR